MGCGKKAIESMRQSFLDKKALNESMHNYMLQQFKIYLLVGGMPDAVNKFLEIGIWLKCAVFSGIFMHFIG